MCFVSRLGSSSSRVGVILQVAFESQGGGLAIAHPEWGSYFTGRGVCLNLEEGV